MTKDALIPEGHFGSDVVAYSAVVTGVPKDFRVHYQYYLDAKQSVEPLEPSLQQAEALRRHERPCNGKQIERYVQTRNRNLYVCSELDTPCRVTYRKHNGRGSTGSSLAPLHERTCVKKRRYEGHSSLAKLVNLEEEGACVSEEPDANRNSTRAAASQTKYWPLQELPTRIKEFLSEAKTSVKPTPRIRAGDNQSHITLSYHCHRGPPSQVAWHERHGLLLHVPFGCVPQQDTLPVNVGCAWSMTLRLPQHYLPNQCPVSGESFTDKDWYKAKAASTDFTDEMQSGADVKCTIHHDHSGHAPGSASDMPFLPVSSEVKQFAMNLFSWHTEPSLRISCEEGMEGGPSEACEGQGKAKQHVLWTGEDHEGRHHLCQSTDNDRELLQHLERGGGCPGVLPIELVHAILVVWLGSFRETIQYCLSNDQHAIGAHASHDQVHHHGGRHKSATGSASGRPFWRPRKPEADFTIPGGFLRKAAPRGA